MSEIIEIHCCQVTVYPYTCSYSLPESAMYNYHMSNNQPIKTDYANTLTDLSAHFPNCVTINTYNNTDSVRMYSEVEFD